MGPTGRGKRSAGGDRNPGDTESTNARRTAHGAAAAGVAFSLLFVASMLTLSRAPGPRSSDATIAAFYGSGESRSLMLAGLYLLPLSAVAFLWFTSVLREWVVEDAIPGNRSNRVLSSVQLLSGVGFIILSLVSAAATIVAAVTVQLGGVPLDPEVARQFPLFGGALLYVFAMRMAAMFVTSTVGVARGSDLLPGWFVAASYAVAALLFLVATLGFWLVLVFPAWVLVLSAIIAVRARDLPMPQPASPEN